MPYTVSLRPHALRNFRSLAPELRARLTPHINALAQNPRPAGVEKLSGSENDYRVRVGDYRILYQIEDAAQVVRVTAIGHRRDIYRAR